MRDTPGLNSATDIFKILAKPGLFLIFYSINQFLQQIYVRHRVLGIEPATS